MRASTLLTTGPDIFPSGSQVCYLGINPSIEDCPSLVSCPGLSPLRQSQRYADGDLMDKMNSFSAGLSLMLAKGNRLVVAHNRAQHELACSQLPGVFSTQGREIIQGRGDHLGTTHTQRQLKLQYFPENELETGPQAETLETAASI
jgi:hypothetical protein